MSALAQFLKQSKKAEIVPLIAIVGAALSGAVFMSAKQSRAPDVAWDHKGNPYPWQDIKDGEQVKLLALNQKYNNRWERTKW
ncbi:NADH-ubiquinone reductase complex 1 MLRQ subunit-domain-containing protein [Dichotomocladium elegans]|nr:NADH-ubiquinone reductase complex 1 MLRQ subunit-domain-containing protein [Dichotomocladium elegans]